MLRCGAAVVLAGGVGSAIGALRPIAGHGPAGHPPADLVAALSAESVLIAAIDATTGGAASVRSALRQVRADHVAHHVALEAAVDAYPSPPPRAAPVSSGAAEALDVAGLRHAEERASARATTRAARLAGSDATLLASIAACEASHAELFQ